MSHRNGMHSPRVRPGRQAPLGAKAELAGRAADILKNVKEFPHIVVHVGTRGQGETETSGCRGH